MHIICKILSGIFISSRIQTAPRRQIVASCQASIVGALCWNAKSIREDAVSASLVTPITVPITAVAPWSPLLTEMQIFIQGGHAVDERRTVIPRPVFSADSVVIFILLRTKCIQHRQANHEMTWRWWLTQIQHSSAGSYTKPTSKHSSLKQHRGRYMLTLCHCIKWAGNLFTI